MRGQMKCPVCESCGVEAALVLGFKSQPGYLDCECIDCGHTWCLILTDGYSKAVRLASGLEA